MKRYFIDIDGTLTHTPGKAWGPIRKGGIAHVKQLKAQGNFIVMWSARGITYVTEFCKKYGISADVILGKPDFIVDDNPQIRTAPHCRRVSPEEFEKGLT